MLAQLSQLPAHVALLVLGAIAVLFVSGVALWISKLFLTGAHVDEFFDGPVTGYSDPGQPRLRS